jgi:hypothetical protein
MTITLNNIDIGDLPNDGTGDPLRIAFDKINLNFTELGLLAPSGPNGSFLYASNGFSVGTSNFAYDATNNSILLAANVTLSGNVTIGNSANRLANIYVGQSSLKLGNVTVTESSNVMSFPITVDTTRNASILVNNMSVEGNGTIAGQLTVGNSYYRTFNITTTTNTVDQILFQMPAVDFKFGTFHIDSREANSNNSQTVTLTVNKAQSNTGLRFCVSGTTFVGNAVTDYNSSIIFGNVRVMVSPFPATTVEHTVTYQITN